MAWTSYQLFIALVMVVTGSINTLSTKWADRLQSVGRDGNLRLFDHPFMQASCMFFGEILCLLTFKVLYAVYSRQGVENERPLTKGNRTFTPWILFLPAMCDMTATSIMYVGLNLTFVSSFQMFRGSVIVFVGLLSVGFLERVLKRREWAGILLVIVGLAVVGLADFLFALPTDESPDRNSIITGDLLIIIAQVITAIQMVVEERFVYGLDIPPLQAVGWEGVFGFSVLALLQVAFYYVPAGPPFSNNSRRVLEDAIEAFVQMANNPLLVVAILGTILSIAFFNFAGISMTKERSATTRMVIDSVRTVVVWIFGLAFLHQQFIWLQLFGFIALVMGMGIYSGFTCRAILVRLWQISARNPDMPDEVIINTPADQPEERMFYA